MGPVQLWLVQSTIISLEADISIVNVLMGIYRFLFFFLFFPGKLLKHYFYKVKANMYFQKNLSSKCQDFYFLL